MSTCVFNIFKNKGLWYKFIDIKTVKQEVFQDFDCPLASSNTSVVIEAGNSFGYDTNKGNGARQV